MIVLTPQLLGPGYADSKEKPGCFKFRYLVADNESELSLLQIATHLFVCCNYQIDLIITVNVQN